MIVREASPNILNQRLNVVIRGAFLTLRALYTLFTPFLEHVHTLRQRSLLQVILRPFEALSYLCASISTLILPQHIFETVYCFSALRVDFRESYSS